MARIVGGCLSQFHNEPDSFELLLSYADGKEIGHVMDRGDAVKLTKSLAEELGLDTVGINSAMYLALKHLREVIAPDHVTLTGHIDFKKGAISVIDEALGRAFANPDADFAVWLNIGPDIAKAAGNVIDVRVTTNDGNKLRLTSGPVSTSSENDNPSDDRQGDKPAFDAWWEKDGDGTDIYELRKEGEWVRVTKKEWIEAERSAGFRPKLSSDHELYMKTCATSGFSGNNIEGRIRLSTS